MAVLLPLVVVAVLLPSEPGLPLGLSSGEHAVNSPKVKAATTTNFRSFMMTSFRALDDSALANTQAALDRFTAGFQQEFSRSRF